MTERTFGNLAIVISLFLSPTTSFASDFVLSGVVVAQNGQPIAGVHVSVYRFLTPSGECYSSKDGSYEVRLPVGEPVDFVAFDHSAWFPKVLEGPFPGKMDSRMNVILLDKKVVPSSLPLALAELHSIQFFQLVLNQHLDLARTVIVPAKLETIKKSMTRPDSMEPPPVKEGRWALGDNFFDATEHHEP